MSSSCKQLDGVAVNDETIEKAKECLRLTLLYIDRTVEPAVFRYIEPDDSYEITGWKREGNKIFYVVRLKDGAVLQVSELELKNIDILLKIRKKFTKS